MHGIHVGTLKVLLGKSMEIAQPQSELPKYDTGSFVSLLKSFQGEYTIALTVLATISWHISSLLKCSQPPKSQVIRTSSSAK